MAIALTYFKFGYIVIDIYIGGTVSQIFNMGSSFYFIESLENTKRILRHRSLHIDVLYMWLQFCE